MAKKDYYVIAYQILSYLYECLIQDQNPERDMLSPDAFDVEPGYWVYIFRHLIDDDLIEGSNFNTVLGGGVVYRIDKLQITPKGIAFLQENSMIQKAKNFLKTVKEIVPGL